MNVDKLIYLANNVALNIQLTVLILLILWLIWIVRRKTNFENELYQSNIKYFKLYESDQDAVMLLNKEHFLECNQSTLKMFGCPTQEVFCTKHPADLSPQYQPCGRSSMLIASEYINFAIENGIHRFDWVHQRIDNGETFPVEVTLSALELNRKLILRALVRNTTVQKQTEAELKLAATIFEAQEGMLITDANNIILRVNSTFTKLTGYSSEDVIGKTANILKSGRHNDDFYADMWKCLKTKGSWAGEIWNRRKNGEIYIEYLIITAVKDKDDNVLNYVATFNDISKNKAAAEKIEHLAYYDPLTNLPNRRLLKDRLKLALASSHRSGQRGALLFLDMDNFKTLNDSLGHDMGDLFLQKVAQRLRFIVREGDTVARLGGDEFVVMLEDLRLETFESVIQAEMIGNKVLIVLNQFYQLGIHKYHCTASIGITLFNGHEHSVEELLKQADIAMYQAKASGRNALCLYDSEMAIKIAARAELEADLHVALAESQFDLYYQPQVCHNQLIIGAEALIRWQHPLRGLVFPGDFIPLAEESELIVSIGHWVLEQACAQLKIWEDNEYTQNLQLSVNVSARQFYQVDFVKQVSEVLSRNDVNPAKLKLELTETMVLKNIDDIIFKMKALHEMGVLFSIDDFGTGHSSLSTLKKLPFNQLKIDQSFVRDISIDPDDAVIVKSIIVMADSLGLDVIAEGVETEAQRVFLEQNNCLTYQGYLFSKPLPIEQFELMLKR